ncbi:hypothetical protein KI387_016690, partial [Taxus chinensis]
DLEHLKLLHESILRHQKLPGPIWKHPNANFKDIHGNLQYLNSKIHTIKKRLSSPYTIDYYTLIGLRRGCKRTDVEWTHLLLFLRPRPDNASHFVERCEFVDERDIDVVKDQARVSALMLYKLLQKSYTYIMTCIMDEEAEKQKQLKAIEARKEEHNVQLQQVFLETNSTADETSMSSTSRVSCNIQGEAPKGKETSESDNGRQCPFFEELDAIFKERERNMDRLLLEVESGARPKQKVRKLKHLLAEKISDEFSEDEEDEDEDSEDEKIVKRKKRRADKERQRVTTDKYCANSMQEVLEDFFQQE